MAGGMMFNVRPYRKPPGLVVTLTMFLLLLPLLVLLCVSEIKVPGKASSVQSFQASSLPGSLAKQAESTVRSADRVDEIADSRARRRGQVLENHHRNLLTAPNDVQNCTCACNMSLKSLVKSCNTNDLAKQLLPTTSGKGACQGQASYGALCGFVGAFLQISTTCIVLCEENEGDATVLMANGGVKLMAAVALGEKVAVRKHDGSFAFEDVYAFGLRDAVATARFVRLTLRPIDANNFPDPAVESRSLELTELHFTTILLGNALINKRAKDVVEGDKMWVQGRASRRLDGHDDPTVAFSGYVVTSILQIPKQGLYNPFTLRGTIIVNGVVASSHSDWFLDSTFELFNAVHWLPAAYQVVLLPVRMLYYGLGKDAYIKLCVRLDTLVDISELLSGRKHGAIVICNIAMAIAGALVFAAMLGRTCTLQPAKPSTC